MLERPRFSIITPAFDAADTIDATIESVRRQTVADWELIVVDDGSRDNTAEIVRAHGDPRVRLLQQPNGGVAAARNLGLEHAVGRYISLLDSDDLYLPDYLERMAGALQAERGASIAYTQAWLLHHESGRVWRRTTAEAFEPWPAEHPATPRDMFLALLRDCFIFVATMVRREVYEREGGFDTRIPVAADDYEMWLRLASRGHRFVRVSEPQVLYRRHAGSITAGRDGAVAGLGDLYRLVATEYDLDPEARGLVIARAAENDSDASAPVHTVRRKAKAAARRVLWPVRMRLRPPAEIATTVALATKRPD